MRRCYFTLLLILSLASAVCRAEDLSKLAEQSGCLACHATAEERIGPSFRQIAERYQPRPEAQEALVRSVRYGSFKRWGDTPMPGATTKEADVRRLVAWILDR